VINVDQNAAYPSAFAVLQDEKQVPERCQLRSNKYLNNLIEQDHRFIKRLVKAGLGFWSFLTAWRTLRGYEIMHMIRKGQLRGAERGDVVSQNASLPKCSGWPEKSLEKWATFALGQSLQQSLPVKPSPVCSRPMTLRLARMGVDGL
jgi:hypothetical protein